MENEAFTDLMQDFALLQLHANPDFFAVLFVYCFEIGMEKRCARISFWNGFGG
jgi:hypothetical protein